MAGARRSGGLGFAAAVAIGAVALCAPRPAAAGQAPADGLTLVEAIAEALDRSPELAGANDAVKLAEVGTTLARSEFAIRLTPTFTTGSDPLIGTTHNAGLSITKRLATGAQVSATLSSYQYGTDASRLRDTGYTVGISQPLLRGFQRTATASVTSSRRAQQSAERERDKTRVTLAVRVTRQYLEIVKQQRLKAAAEQAAERAVRLRVASEARVQVGLATELDVLRARILASQSTAAVAAADGALAGATDQLAILIGRSLDVPLAIAPADTTPIDFVDALPASSDELVRAALASRTEIREARDQAADAVRVAAVAAWQGLPPVTLDVSYTQRGIGVADGGLNSLLGGWRIGLGTSYAVDRATHQAAMSHATIAAAASSARVREIEHRVVAEVHELHRAWLTATTMLAIHGETLELAARELELAELRFQRGLASSLDVVGAETTMLTAEHARIAAELDRKVLALDLQRAIGALDLATLLGDRTRP